MRWLLVKAGVHLAIGEARMDLLAQGPQDSSLERSRELQAESGLPWEGSKETAHGETWPGHTG